MSREMSGKSAPLPLFLIIKFIMMKIYQAIQDKNLSISIYIDGKELRVTFSGGDAATNGVFSTSDTNVQKSLEESDMFNKYYRIFKTFAEKKSPIVGPGVAVTGAISSEDLKANGLLAGQTTLEPVKTQPEPVVEAAPAPAPVESADAEPAKEAAAEETKQEPDASATDEAPIEEKAAEEVESADEPTSEEDSEEVVENAPASTQVVKFRNVPEAQDYFMKEPYKVLKSKLMTSKAILEVAAQFEVNVVFER